MIQFDKVNFEWDGDKKIFKNMNLNIKQGEFVVITGESGCGKSTLGFLINGLIPYFYKGKLSGNVYIDKKNTRELELYQIGMRVGSVFQDPRSQFFTMTTTEEVGFGCQNIGLERQEIERRIDQTFIDLKIKTLKDQSVFELSSGEKQKIAIASCYAMKPSVFVMDEPSANLDMFSTLELKELLRNLKTKGHTIIIMEHRLFYLKELADRMLIVKGEEVKYDLSAYEINTSSNDKQKEMALRSLDLPNLRCENSISYLNEGNRLEVKDLNFSYRKKHNRSKFCRNHFKYNEVLKNLSFEAAGGEVIAIVGSNGAGKTTLARVLCGLESRFLGTIKLNGQLISKKELTAKSYYIMQDSDYQLFEDSVLNEMLIGLKKTEPNIEKVKAILLSLGLIEYIDKHPFSLSRGQKQRLTIACALMKDSDYLFFDEPTSGLDLESMLQVVNHIKNFSKRGKILLIISHDYEFLLHVATRILTVSNGYINEDFILTEETKDKLLRELCERRVIDELYVRPKD